MLGTFVSDVCGEFGTTGSAVRLDFSDIFGAETRGGFRLSFFRRFSFSFLFCLIFFFEDGATDDGVSFRVRGGFFVLGFREVGGQGCDFVVV